jgi:glycerol-3-phosphate dehydrogenase (NAD(P)+)
VSRHSRNRRLGEGLARGWTLAELQAATPGHAEGADTVGPVLRLGARFGVELPVCATVGDVLAGEITPQEAVVRLVGAQGASTSSNSWS